MTSQPNRRDFLKHATLLPLGAATGIALSHFPAAAQVLDIVKRVDSEWFGVIVDTGNFQQGDPYDEIARVVPHAVNFQVKESPYGKDSPVRIDLPRLVRVVRDGGYRGYLPIETLVPTAGPYDPRIAVPRFLQQVREAVEQGA